MSHRLPAAIRPKRYDLHLTVDPARDDFDGLVTITAEVVEATDEVVLHAKNLRIASATVSQSRSGEAATGQGKAEGAATILQGPAQPADVSLDGDRAILRPAVAMGPGEVTIEIRYAGLVRHDMAGLYLSKDGQRMCLATQCEATDARTIVPCWDEPEYKAAWAWTVTAPEGLKVLTNGAAQGSEAADGMTTHCFAATPPMSSYLIACCVGDFAATPPVVARGKEFRVWAMRGQERHGAIGNGFAVRMLPWYEDYFGHEYAFGKYDQIAVPSFAFGAMENAGLVLFRPSLVLMDEKTASWDDRRHVALVVAHEFAHMWFGDLVTMAWWDDLWLNEAFAEWIAHKCVATLEPDLDVWVPFRQRAGGALSTDSLSSTHAIYHPVKTPEEAQEMFDAVTYGKGSAVMRMIESYLGEEAFRSGLRSYMQAFRFANAHGKDLWQHLGKASGQDVAGIMGDWVTQAGHPTVECAWDGRLSLRQSRTTSSPLAGDLVGLWRIPMVVRYADDAGVHEHRILLEGEAAEVDLPVEGNLHWLWPNAGDGGFYRVRLDEGLLRKGLENADALQPPERVALLRDVWIQVRAGREDVTAFLHALEGLLDGTDHYEVVEFTTGVARMLDGLLEDEAQAAYRSWLADALREAWTDAPAKTPADRQRRAALLRAMGGVALDGQAVAAARKVATDERNGKAADPELATVAVAVEAAAGDVATLQRHLDTYNERRAGDASPQEVERYVYALPSYRDAGAVARIIDLLAKEGIAAQAEGPVLRAMLVQPHAQEAAWQHLQANWDATIGRLGEAWLAILVEACGELPTKRAQEVVAFLDSKLEGRAGQAYGRAKERLAERAELEERIGHSLRAWASGLRVETPA